MSKSLVIVESPAKATTLGKFLGKDFTVAACYGHVRDLPKKGISVDRDRGYEPTYEILPGKERTIAELRRLAKGADQIYLAADPDREGEAICWHLEEILRPAAPKAIFHRAEFHEITRSAVAKAIENPGTINRNRVAAQQARRIIDRIVGYEVSDLLWAKLWRGLSAGRVQTVALRIIVEREAERDAFRSIPYFSVPATLSEGGLPFPARVIVWRGEKLRFDGTDPRLATAEAAAEVVAHIEACRSALRVLSVEAKERRTSSPPPFTTSKLQQGAARTLGFTVRRTMQVAQRLYEGKTIGDRGTVGLITYMRTDSTRTAAEAITSVRAYVAETWGQSAVPEEPRFFRQRRDAQDAHEAIRPTSMALPPEVVARFLQPEELKLYRLIWSRFVASQMNPTLTEVTTAEIEAVAPGREDAALLRATGSVLKDPGWLRAWGQEDEASEADDSGDSKDSGDEGASKADAKVRLPALVAGARPLLQQVSAEGHETQPPPRFNEASLVKFLEENGIGRPSTYADILRKIEDREYVRKRDRRFLPTLLGRLVVDLMREGFDDFFQTEYTARMEEELDEVEDGLLDWRKALAEFDGKFSKDRELAKKRMISVKAGLALVDVRKLLTNFPLPKEVEGQESCPKSGHPLKLRMGKAGLFIACGGYPECEFTINIPEIEEDPVDQTELEGQTCEECGSPMKLRTGRNGSSFLGCTAYPTCRATVAVKVAGGKAEAKPDRPTGETCPACSQPLITRHGRFGDYVACSGFPACRYRPPKPVTTTSVACPDCGVGEILVRKGRFGPFYGCSNYPTCKRNFRARPVQRPCPLCNAPYLLVRERKAGAFFVCEREECDFDAPAADLDLYVPTTGIPEGARVAALAEAAQAPAASKKTSAKKALKAPPKRGARKAATGKAKKEKP